MRAFLICLFALMNLMVFAQIDESSNDLQEQYNELKRTSNNYQIYKVVKETALDEFWASAGDTLQRERAKISALQNEVASLKSEMTELKDLLEERGQQLEEQEFQIEHMSFLGIALTKATYITFTWILIFALLLAAIIFYARFHGANRTTTQTKKEIEQLQDEFEQHRQRTRENETKLKRDLQTEINKVEELKSQLEGNN